MSEDDGVRIGRYSFHVVVTGSAYGSMNVIWFFFHNVVQKLVADCFFISYNITFDDRLIPIVFFFGLFIRLFKTLQLLL